jgi:hypothetical protein
MAKPSIPVFLAFDLRCPQSHESIWAWAGQGKAAGVTVLCCQFRSHGRLCHDVDVTQRAHEGSGAVPRAVR